MNTITVIEAEFVEVGKHQKAVTSIAYLETFKAKELFTTWCYTNAYPNFSDNKMKGKSIRNQLRSFGWYIVKSKAGYSLMEEVTADDLRLIQMNDPFKKINWFDILNELDFDPGLNLIISIVKKINCHIVWVPSLQKRLIMRSVA